MVFGRFLFSTGIYCCAGRSEFLLRAEPERSEGGLSEEIKTARAWPRAAQHKLCFLLATAQSIEIFFNRDIIIIVVY